MLLLTDIVLASAQERYWVWRAPRVPVRWDGRLARLTVHDDLVNAGLAERWFWLREEVTDPDGGGDDQANGGAEKNEEEDQVSFEGSRGIAEGPLSPSPGH